MPYQPGQALTGVMLNRNMGAAQPSGNDTFTTTVKVLTADTVTFTAIPSHTYAVSWSTQHSSSGACVMTLCARYVAGAGPILTGSTIIWQRIAPSAAGNDVFYARRTVTDLSGQVTVGITGLANAAATTTVYGGSVDRELLVEDLGP